ncbi:alpha/beta hydrolase [Roseimaritima sediminicola]|uniref:alpha/beta hydrolase n=1 Tax=Roseimaritima sediminicola TaxID=2662066 RepID=UPI0012985815|nr:alpha/beta hydrolase-fold protein [Roseimaritima sediminicola]
MYRSLPLLCFALHCGLATLTGYAQTPVATSVVDESGSLSSEILDQDRKYAIYLPPGYHTSTRSYPVLYLLHGAGDDHTGWVQFGEVQHIADRQIAAGKATPMVIVMPDANTGRRGYFNDIRGDWDYEDFFFEELIPHIEKNYRVRTDKRYRAIGGLSMGGGGSFMYAMHRPDMFSSACPLSAYTGPLTLEDARRRFERQRSETDKKADADAKADEDKPQADPRPQPSDEQMESYFKRHSAVELARSLPKDDLASVRWYIDCGDDDFLYEGNALVHIEFRKRGIDHEYRVRDGGHRWSYWRSALPDVLHFVSEAFHQH